MADLVVNVPGLLNAVQHGPAPWSVEMIYGKLGERHLTVFPAGDPESFRRFTIGTPPGDYVTDTYGIMIWEAAVDMTRLVDDDTANAAWVQLYQDVRDRFFIQANIAMGEAGAYTHWVGGQFGQWSSGRLITASFNVEVPKSFV
jgi:hypothetical protein